MWRRTHGRRRRLFRRRSRPLPTTSRSAFKELLVTTNFFKNKQASAVLCCRSSTARVGQRRRAELGSERGSGQYS